MNILTVNNLDAHGTCNLMHRGTAYESLLTPLSYTFKGGNLYGIIGEFGDGISVLSNCLTGNIGIANGDLYYNDVPCTPQTISSICCYVGTDTVKGFSFWNGKFTKYTVKKQIEYGLKKTKNCAETSESVKKLFKLSDERFNRPLKYVSGEVWKASMAIGYANGKKIYCFPYLNTRDIRLLQPQLTLPINILINNNCIVILPTTSEENVYSIYPKYDIINMSF